MSTTPTEIIIKKVRDEIKSRMGDDGIYDVVNLSFKDMDFDFTDICESIAHKEFDRIISNLESAVEIINEAFL